MIAPQVRVDAAGDAAVILLVAFEGVVALDQLGALAAGAGEQALRAADAGVALQIVLKLDGLLGRARMLVAQACLSFMRAQRRTRSLVARPAASGAAASVCREGCFRFTNT